MQPATASTYPRFAPVCKFGPRGCGAGMSFCSGAAEAEQSYWAAARRKRSTASRLPEDPDYSAAEPEPFSARRYSRQITRQATPTASSVGLHMRELASHPPPDEVVEFIAEQIAESSRRPDGRANSPSARAVSLARCAHEEVRSA